VLIIFVNNQLDAQFFFMYFMHFIVHQVGYLQRLQRDARSTKHMCANKYTYLMQDILLCCTPHYIGHQVIQRCAVPFAVRSIHKVLPPPQITIWIKSQELHQAKQICSWKETKPIPNLHTKVYSNMKITASYTKLQNMLIY